MAMIELVRLGRDAELRFTPSGDPVANLAMVYDYGRKGPDGKRQSQWLDGSLWGKRAEALAPYLVKGQQLMVTLEEVHMEEYESQGQTRSKLVARVGDVKLAGAPQAQQGGQQQSARQQSAPQQNQAPVTTESPDYFDDDK